MGDDQVEAVIGSLRAGVEALRELDRTRLDAVALTQLLCSVEQLRRQLDAVDQHTLAEVEQRNVAGEYGRTSTADLLVELLRVAPAEAKARVHAARDLGPRRSVTGGVLAPLFSHVAAAVANGSVGAGQVRVITRCLDRLPPHLDTAAVERAERVLVDAAAHVDARQLGQVAERLLAYVDPDGVEPREERAQRLRGFTLVRHADGTATPTGTLTPATTAVWQPILDTLSAPHVDPDNADPDSGAERDDRSAAQRRHDGFLEAGLRLLRSGSLPDAGGVPVTILARVDAQQLKDQAGVAVTGTGDLLPIRELLQLAAEAEIIPVVLTDAGGILSYGRTRRLASCAQRKALALRDGGCCFPGCTRPASWCETHHVLPWLDDGRTDLDNMCLLCAHHHREFATRGWAVRMSDGVPEWIPPPWLDPQRKPRRNTAHHPPDIDFDVGLAG